MVAINPINIEMTIKFKNLFGFKETFDKGLVFWII
jgi:hypothetical protein